MYTVKEVSMIMNMSPYTLRFYEQKGLFPFVTRNEKNVRIFSEEDLEWVYMVKCLRDTGLSIVKVKEYIDLCVAGEETVPERLILLSIQRNTVKNKLNEVESMLEMIEYKISSYEKFITKENKFLFNPFKDKYIDKTNEVENN